MDKKQVKKIIVDAVEDCIKEKLPGTFIRQNSYTWSADAGSDRWQYTIDFPKGFLSPAQLVYFRVVFTRMHKDELRMVNYNVPTDVRKKMIENYCKAYESTMRESGIKSFKISPIKKFAMRSWWGKEEIHFESIEELEQWLAILIPESVDSFAKLADQT